MGISRCAARLLLEECHDRPFAGSILQLGRQSVHITATELAAWGSSHHVVLQPVPIELSPFPALRAKRYISDITFFRTLGFEVVESLDLTGFEGATYTADLNQPVPDVLRDRFDVILDGGTLEHVFNVPQSLKNVHQMLRAGGRIIHVSPTSNWVDHGFYMFSPTLFHDYYTANRYFIHRSYLIEGRNGLEGACDVYNYRPGALDAVGVGGFDRGRLVLTFVVAERQQQSTGDVVPQQGYYQALWSGEETKEQSNSSRPSSVRLRNTIAALLRRAPGLTELLRGNVLVRRLRRRKNMPPVAARY